MNLVLAGSQEGPDLALGAQQGKGHLQALSNGTTLGTMDGEHRGCLVIVGSAAPGIQAT
jgi:hypothetical protein